MVVGGGGRGSRESRRREPVGDGVLPRLGGAAVDRGRTPSPSTPSSHVTPSLPVLETQSRGNSRANSRAASRESADSAANTQASQALPSVSRQNRRSPIDAGLGQGIADSAPLPVVSSGRQRDRGDSLPSRGGEPSIPLPSVRQGAPNATSSLVPSLQLAGNLPQPLPDVNRGSLKPKPPPRDEARERSAGLPPVRPGTRLRPTDDSLLPSMRPAPQQGGQNELPSLGGRGRSVGHGLDPRAADVALPSLGGGRRQLGSGGGDFGGGGDGLPSVGLPRKAGRAGGEDGRRSGSGRTGGGFLPSL